MVERDAWINSLDPAVRRCVTADPIRLGDGTASVEFRVEEGCERTLSLAAYPLVGGEFSFEEEQELADAATGTFGPGTHELAVDLSSVGCPQPSDGYDRVAKLVADDRASGDRSGDAVAVSGSGDTLVVGAPGNEGRGSAYVFERADGTWTQRAKLTTADAMGGDSFDGSMAVSVPGSGDTAVVGAPGDEVAGVESGSAYVFGRTDGEWTRRAGLGPDDSGHGDGFGLSVTVSGSGDTAVTGQPMLANPGPGSAHVFET